MKIKNFATLTGFGLAVLLFAGMSSATLAQGRGGGGDRPANPGPPAGAGASRGGNSDPRSTGRPDDVFGTPSTRGRGSEIGRGQATMPSNNELHRYTGISKKLDTTPEALRTNFQAAVAANPNLTWGQFVAANVVADNLGGRFPNITSAAILTGLQNGDSIGKTLRTLGMGKDEAEQTEKDAKRQIKESKKNQ